MGMVRAGFRHILEHERVWLISSEQHCNASEAPFVLVLSRISMTPQSTGESGPSKTTNAKPRVFG